MFEILGRLPNVARPFRRLTTPGAEPGLVMVHPQAGESEIEVIVFDAESIEERRVQIEDIVFQPEPGKVTWINVEGLGNADVINTLGHHFGLHPLALEDVVHIHQRAKVEDYEEYLFIVARMPVIGERIESEQLSLFLGENFVITFQEGNPGDCLEPVRKRLRQATGRARKQGADYLAYSLLDAVVDAYFPILEHYGDRLDELDADLSDDQTRVSLARVHQLRSELSHLRRHVWPHREAIGQLARFSNTLISAETQLYLRDTYDHTNQLIDVLETYRELCADLREFFYSALSIRANEVMKVLTIIATIFIPLSFIAGVYGMNFEHMPELEWRYGYPMALTFMGLVAVGLLGFIWRKGWFET